jgi:type I restriction enzyme M protein
MGGYIRNRIVSFIWSIADDCLRDVFIRVIHRNGILPMFILRGIDSLLEDAKEAVLAEVSSRGTRRTWPCSIPMASSKPTAKWR